MNVSDTVKDLEEENKRLKGLLNLYETIPLRLRYIKLERFAELTGYTNTALRQKKKAGKWVEGIHILKVPDGNLLVDIYAYEAWCRGELDPTDFGACEKWLKNTNDSELANVA